MATSANQYGASYKAAIDGLTIQNGDVLDFVPNINSLGNGTRVGGGNNTPANPNQGGGIVAFAATQNLQITNNIIRSNATAPMAAPSVSAPRWKVTIIWTAFALPTTACSTTAAATWPGAVGIFNGAGGYEIANNDLCGNFSAEYGGAISHFGRSDQNGSMINSIHDNRIYFNGSYDEGGGVIIAGEPPVNASTFGAGAGAVNIYNNVIEANLVNDDGGGLRFLTAGNFPYNVYNNMIVNNISTHEGGGVAIDNAPNVRFYNNTVMQNLTTATAATSNGQAAPAGLSTAPTSSFLQSSLPSGSPTYSNPLLFNNIFYDNRAGTWDGGNIVGIGGLIWSNGVQVPDPTPANHWDMGAPGTAFQLSPTNSILQTETTNHNDVVASPTNKVDQDPAVVATFDTSVMGLPWRGNPNFVANTIVAQDVPVTIMGNYHLLNNTSPAIDMGATSKAAPSYQQPPASIAAPAFDIDNQTRPALTGYDSGADEFGASSGGGGGGGGGPVRPTLAVLDNFDRANRNTLGLSNTTTNWSQVVGNSTLACLVLGGGSPPCAATRINSNQALGAVAGSPIWNGPGNVFGTTQAAAITFANAPVNGLLVDTGVIMKANGGSNPALPTNFIRVEYENGQVIVATTTNAGLLNTTRGSFTAAFATNDILTALVDATGTVYVWQTSGATDAYLGSVTLPTTGANAWTTGTGRIGMLVPATARVDNFSGGSVTTFVPAALALQSVVLASFGRGQRAIEQQLGRRHLLCRTSKWWANRCSHKAAVAPSGGVRPPSGPIRKPLSLSPHWARAPRTPPAGRICCRRQRRRP
ncbi:MAG: right-handed parallel beta-helix repeat-containing protein [Caldilineaceae bacterium]